MTHGWRTVIRVSERLDYFNYNYLEHSGPEIIFEPVRIIASFGLTRPLPRLCLHTHTHTYSSFVGAPAVRPIIIYGRVKLAVSPPKGNNENRTRIPGHFSLSVSVQRPFENTHCRHGDHVLPPTFFHAGRSLSKYARIIYTRFRFL